MSGTSKAVLSICVLLLAALVVYYGMTPANRPSVTVGDIPARNANEVQLFGRDLDAAAAALGIPPAVVEITEEPVAVDKMVDAEIPKSTPPIQSPLPQDPVVTREVVVYTVMLGDTLGGISLDLFGSSKYATKIAHFNGIDDPRNIQPGRNLRIPELTQAKPKSTVSKPAVSTDRETYVIQSGETLSDIAEDFLGSPHKWRLIWEANKQRISNPDRLKIGTTIVIP